MYAKNRYASTRNHFAALALASRRFLNSSAMDSGSGTCGWLCTIIAAAVRGDSICVNSSRQPSRRAVQVENSKKTNFENQVFSI